MTRNLVALGAISQEDLCRFLKKHPVVPASIEETGLSSSFIADLIMKHIHFLGEFMISDVADGIKLPVSLVNKIVEMLKKDRLVEVTGGSSFSSISYKYRITDLGKNRGAELMDLCRYVGPAPVSLDAYRESKYSVTWFIFTHFLRTKKKSNEQSNPSFFTEHLKSSMV